MAIPSMKGQVNVHAISEPWLSHVHVQHIGLRRAPAGTQWDYEKMGTAQVPRMQTALSLRTFDRLDYAASAKINLRCIYRYILFTTGGGVHALT